MVTCAQGKGKAKGGKNYWESWTGGEGNGGIHWSWESMFQEATARGNALHLNDGKGPGPPKKSTAGHLRKKAPIMNGC